MLEQRNGHWETAELVYDVGGSVSCGIVYPSGLGVACEAVERPLARLQLEAAVGLALDGDIGGALVIQNSVTSTGYRSISAPADPSKLDADDLLDRLGPQDEVLVAVAPALTEIRDVACLLSRVLGSPAVEDAPLPFA